MSFSFNAAVFTSSFVIFGSISFNSSVITFESELTYDVVVNVKAS